MKFSLKQIEIFLLVVETLSLTRAAEQYYVTVPAVSKHIKNLEALSEGKLFKVIGKQLHLTDHAQKLIPQARKLLLEAQQFDTQLAAREKQEESVPLNIGNTYQRLVFHHLQKFRNQYPQIELSLQISIWGEQQQVMLEQPETLFIAGEPSVSSAEFHVERLVTSPLILVVCPNHPLMQHSQLTVRHLASYPWCVSGSLSRSQRILFDWLGEAHLEKPLLKLSSFESVQYAVEAGLAIACLPEYIVAAAIQQKKLVKFIVEGFPIINWSLTLVYRRDMQLSESMLKLMQYLRRVL